MDKELETYLRRSPKPQFSAELFRAGVTSKFTRDCQAEIYEIGSVGKVFTTTLLAILDRQGFISINDLVSKFRSDLPFAGQVSLRQLASHTSGLPSNPLTGIKLVTESYLGMFISSFREEDFNRYLRNLRRLRSPGRFRYSNVGMALLGEILSSALGTSYESAVIEYICKPLGMSDTSVAVPQMQGNLVVGHNSKGRPVEPFKWAGMEAAGVWRSTTGDMMKFLRAMLGYSGDGWRELAGATTNPVAKVSKRVAVGLGWLTYKSERVGTLIWHDGGTLGQNAAVAWSQELDSACVLCTNQRPGLREILLPGRDIGTVAIKILSGSSGKST